MVDSLSDRISLGADSEQNDSEHIALIYETAEERLAAIAPLIKAGLGKREICLYISNEEDDPDIIEALRAEQVDIEKAVSTGGLILSHKREIFLKTGRFDPDWTLRVIENVAELGHSYGFTAMSIITDMAWVLDDVPGVERWAEYEAKMNTLDFSIPVRIICQYDRTAFSPEAMISVLRTHHKVASQDAIHKNAFFVPADQMLQGEIASAELKSLMESIRTSSSLEMELQARDEELSHLHDQLKKEALSHETTEFALAESRKRFDDLAERTSDWFWELDKDGKYAYVSPRVKDILGMQEDEVLGRSPLDLVEPDDVEMVKATLVPAMSNHEPIVALEKKVRHLNGHSVYLEMNGYPWLDEEGSFLGYRGVDRDITEHKISKRTIEEGRKKLDVATAEAMARDDRIRTMEKELEELRDSLGEKEASILALEQAIERKEGELVEATQEQEALRDSLSSRENELQQVSASLDAKDEELAKQHAQLEALQQDQTNLEAELARLHEELEKVRSAVTLSENALAQLKEAMVGKEAELTSAVAAISAKEAEVEEISSRLDEKIAELASILKERDDLKIAAEEGAKEMEQRMEELSLARSQAQQHLEEVKELREILRAKETAHASAVAQVDEGKVELANSMQQIKDLEAANDVLEEDQERLTALLQEREAQISRMEKEIEGLRAQDGERTAELASQEIELSIARQRIGTVEEELTQLTETLRSNEGALTQLKVQAAAGAADALTKTSAAAELEATLASREEELREFRGREKALFEQSVAGIACVDLEGNLLRANDAFCKMIGHESAELIGKSYREYTHRDDLITSAELYQNVLAGEAASTSMLKRYVRGYGDPVWVDLSLSAVRDAEGRPLYLMAVVSDRTHQMSDEATLQAKEQKSEDGKSDLKEPSDMGAPVPDSSLIDARSEKIAHQLNDALTVIMGSVSLAKEYVIPEGRMFGQLEQVERASEEVRTLVSQLQNASHDIAIEASNDEEPVQGQPVDLIMGRGKILLVDEGESILEATEDMLIYLGYTVDVARDVEEATMICQEARESQQPFQLAILDLDISEAAGGRNIAAKLARENPEMKMIASTGDLTDPVLAEPAAYGFSTVLPRPYTIDILSKVVSEILPSPERETL